MMRARVAPRTLAFLLFCGGFFGLQSSMLALQSVTLAWDPSTDSDVVSYRIYYGFVSGSYTNKIATGNATNATIAGLVDGTTYYFAATAVNSSGLESDPSNEVAYSVPPGRVDQLVNQAPTLDPIMNLAINESSGLHTVSLSGITAGSNEVQSLTVTATSSNPGIIPNPTITYTSSDTNGTLTFAPAFYAFGTAVITVTVNDGQPTNSSFSHSFAVTVNPVNQPPTLDPLAKLSINPNTGPQTVYLTGISSGAPNELQALTVSAISSNPNLIPNPTINYLSPNAMGTLLFTPATNGSGNAIITVTINDGQPTNNTVIQSFGVSIAQLRVSKSGKSVNQPPTLDPVNNVILEENSGMKTIPLSGITSGATNELQTLVVTAISSNPNLLPNPTVNYIGPNTTGTLSFAPAPDAFGTVSITVTVDDGHTANNAITRSFIVTINQTAQSPAIIDGPGSQIVYGNSSAFFQVSVTGTAPLSYQWMKAGTNIPGATDSSLTLTNLCRASGGAYAVGVSNPAGTVVSTNAVLRVIVPQRLTPPSLQADGSVLLISGDSDGGTLTQADLPGFQALSSTNMADWTAVTGSLMLSNGALWIRDYAATNSATHYYRVVEKP